MVTLQEIQSETVHEAICEVDEGEEAGFSCPKVTWCPKQHGSLYLPVKNINLVHN